MTSGSLVSKAAKVADMMCTAEGCRRNSIPSYRATVTLCRAHADEVLAGPCAVAGCERPVKSIMRRLCGRHLHVERRYGSADAPTKRRPYGLPSLPCSYVDCGRPARSHGLCVGHNSQRKAGGELRPLRPKARRDSVKPYIEQALRQRDRTTGCWIDWPYGKSDDRPTLRHDGRRVLVACYVLWLETGEWPEFACHHCDEGACWNPACLYPGTAKSNAEDRERRRRGRNQYGPRLRDRA